MSSEQARLQHHVLSIIDDIDRLHQEKYPEYLDDEVKSASWDTPEGIWKTLRLVGAAASRDRLNPAILEAKNDSLQTNFGKQIVYMAHYFRDLPIEPHPEVCALAEPRFRRAVASEASRYTHKHYSSQSNQLDRIRPRHPIYIVDNAKLVALLKAKGEYTMIGFEQLVPETGIMPGVVSAIGDKSATYRLMAASKGEKPFVIALEELLDIGDGILPLRQSIFSLDNNIRADFRNVLTKRKSLISLDELRAEALQHAPDLTKPEPLEKRVGENVARILRASPTYTTSQVSG